MLTVCNGGYKGPDKYSALEWLDPGAQPCGWGIGGSKFGMTLLSAYEKRMEISSIPDDVRALIGRKRTRSHYVTELEIVRFAQATGNTIIRHGGEIEAPLLFTQALAYEPVPVDQLPEDGSPWEPNVPLPGARTVGGSSEYEIFRRVRVGDTITISSCLKDVYAKHGRKGLFYCVVVETNFADAEGEPVARELATFIKMV